jgi:hypothetical protein
MKTTIAILLSMIFGAPALAATFVYVSNADDGEIRTYTLQADGSLKPGQTAKAEKIVMPMVVTPDKRFVGTGPLAESFPPSASVLAARDPDFQQRPLATCDGGDDDAQRRIASRESLRGC